MMEKKSPRGRKLKFPDVSNYKPSCRAVLCPADRIIGLFNQAQVGKVIKHKMCDSIRNWFSDEAKKHHWPEPLYVPEVESAHGAGAILFNPHHVVVQLNVITINLEDGQQSIPQQ